MMKFPFSVGEGSAPSGSSFALTYPGVLGSRVGMGGRGGRAGAGGSAWAWLRIIGTAAAKHTRTKGKILRDNFIQPLCSIVGAGGKCAH